MNGLERKRLAIAVGALGEAFGRNVTTVTIRAYEIGLAGLSIAAIEHAVNRAVAERKFMPVPSELRELAGELAPEDRAVKAWGAVKVALSGNDYYDTVVFDDPVTTATIRHLWKNWMRFTEIFESTDEVWMRKEFQTVYCSLMRSGINEDLSRPLLGYFEQQNLQRKHTVPPVTMVSCGLPEIPGLRYTPAPRITEMKPEIAGLLESTANALKGPDG